MKHPSAQAEIRTSKRKRICITQTWSLHEGAALAMLVVMAACGEIGGVEPDAASTELPGFDGSSDSGGSDAGPLVEDGSQDGGHAGLDADTGSEDAASTADAGLEDAASTADAGLEDAASTADAGLEDAGLGDVGLQDAGLQDADLGDVGLPDTGFGDSGASPDGGGLEPEYVGMRQYTTWGSSSGSYTGDFHVWVGAKTLLRSRRAFVLADARAIVNNLDSCLDLYQRLGQTQWPTIVDPEFGRKGQVSMVPNDSTCGAGCGAGGKAELTEGIFDYWRGWRADTDPYAWWVGCYELGRQGGRAFPVFGKLDHYRGGSTEPGERMTSAFPEYIWHTWLRKLGFSQSDLEGRGPFASGKYRRGFLASTLSYVEAIEPDTVDRTVPGSNPVVWPSWVMTSVFFHLHERYGDAFMEAFFGQVLSKPTSTNARQSACNLLQSATEADTSRSADVEAYLVVEWRFPSDC